MGRGGTGNVFKPVDDEAVDGESESHRLDAGADKKKSEPEKGLAAKGKDWLLGKK